MYVYDEIDQRLAEERAVQFADQTRRFLRGQLTEDAFRALRLQNGLSIQRHAPMLRVAIPYGMLNAKQLRMLAHIARRWDRGYGQLNTRESIQFNWLRLEDVPSVLAELASVRMHALQASGNRICCTTADDFAGIAPDEVINPLVWCELIRQWAMLHPEFANLAHKLQIAVSGLHTDPLHTDPLHTDPTAAGAHDIGLQGVEQEGQRGFRVWIDGGALTHSSVRPLVHPFVHWPHLLTYLQSMLHVYSLHAQRDNRHKARIDVLVNDLTPEVFAEQVRQEWPRAKDGPGTVLAAHLERVAARFTWPSYDAAAAGAEDPCEAHALVNPAFARWLSTNVRGHRVPGYAAVILCLKKTGVPPGHITADQMDAVADLAGRHGFGELRVSHVLDLILTDVRRHQLYRLWRELDVLGLAAPNAGR